MPMRMEPWMLRAISAPVSTRPKSESSVVGFVTWPRPMNVALSGIIRPVPLRPMKAMKRPMPTPMATRRFCGTALMMAWRMWLIVRIRNRTPEKKTAPSATVQ